MSTKLKHAQAAVQEGRLVILAGAGISMGPPANFPSWAQLVDRMVEHCREHSPARAAAIEEQRQHDLLAAIDLYEIGNIVPPVERARFLREQFQGSPQLTTDVARALAKLPARLYITTNYDPVLKNALKDEPVEVLSNSDAELHTAISLLSTQRMLVHLHGRAPVTQSLVLGTRSYEQLASRESYKHLLRETFLRYAVVAVGFSFTDPPFLRLLEYIGTELGGAGTTPHLAILAESTTVDAKILGDANFEVLRYDDGVGHDEVLRILGQLRGVGSSPRLGSKRPRPPPPPADSVALELSRIYASLTAKHRGQAFDLAAAALVVHGISSKPQRPDVLARQLSRRMALSKEVAEQLVKRGTLVLKQGGSVSDNNGVLKLMKWKTDSEPPRALVTALHARLAALDTRKGATLRLQESALAVVKRVMLVQGMTAARAFVEADAPDAYLLETVVREAVGLAKVDSGDEVVVADAVTQVLRSPTKDVSRELFELAHAAFALETVFLNPVHTDLGAVLAWQLYLDSNIVMRLLHPACDATRTFQPLLQRLLRLRIPLTVIRPFLDEVIAHAQRVERQVTGMAHAAVNALLRATPEQEQSPLLRWFSFSQSERHALTFSQFRQQAGLVDLNSLVPVVEKLGIDADQSDAIRVYDSAERETLWNDLREFRARDQSSQGARRLRRAEATQVMWLAHLRDKGTRAWFLSQDGQLRRALKYIQQGRYAGYVATPAAWMMKLSELHWGDVDVAGFSELMWLIPLSKPTERLREQVAAGVLRRVPDLGGKEPEWLRDRIEDELQRIDPLVTADLAQDDDGQDDGLARWAQHVVPPAVDRILDQLAASQRRR